MTLLLFVNDSSDSAQLLRVLADNKLDTMVKICREGARKYPKEASFPGLYDPRSRQFHSDVGDITFLLNMLKQTAASASPGPGGDEYVGPSPFNMTFASMPVELEPAPSAPSSGLGYGDRVAGVHTRGISQGGGGDALERLMQSRDRDLKQVKF